MTSKLLAGVFILALPFAVSATEYRTVERPRQECWNEQVPVQAAGQGYGGAIVGGLAGGILGNQVGKGNGRTVATAVGAMTGAVVGDRMSSNGASYQNVQRCRTVYDQVQEPVVVRERVQVVTQPVIERRVYYVEQEEHGNRGWHGHHRGHHDDDDD
jgi:uncharacterized protein YcfJ